MDLDYEQLRSDLLDECAAAYLVGGIGTALIDEIDIENASDEELIDYAIEYGWSLKKYEY